MYELRAIRTPRILHFLKTTFPPNSTPKEPNITFSEGLFVVNSCLGVTPALLKVVCLIDETQRSSCYRCAYLYPVPPAVQ